MPRKATLTPMLKADTLAYMLDRRRLPRGLSYREAWFLTLLYVRPSLTRADYQAATGVCANTAQVDLAQLVNAGLVVRLGAGPACRYSLAPHLDPDRDYLLNTATKSHGNRHENARDSQ